MNISRPYFKRDNLIDKRRVLKTILLPTVLTITTLMVNITSYAEPDYAAEAEARKNLQVQSNSYTNWPTGPKIGAESALLIEANTGTILYEKNIDERLYPASVTKLLTALVAYDNSNLSDMVTFSEEAIASINWRNDANMGISPGNSITMEQCLYGLLVGSANEVAYAIAEHISGPGNIQGFADLMNAKATSLGCTNSHFVTPNGIHDENHYTSAHDLSLIAQAFFSNDVLCRMSSTTTYHVPQTATQPREDMIVYAKSKLHPGKEYAYPDLVGTKTGYTDYARQTLVSCAERGNIKLICVIMKEESPYQFIDTVDLFNYGFDNFYTLKIADNDTKYSITQSDFFDTDSSIFFNNNPVISIDENNYIVLPNNAVYDDLDSELSYDNLSPSQIARINYSYYGNPIGSANIFLLPPTEGSYNFGEKLNLLKSSSEENIMIINIRTIILIIIGSVFLLSILNVGRIRLFKRKKERRKSNNSKKYNINGTARFDWRHFK